MTRRRLTQEEIDLWRKVAEKAERLHPDRKTPPPKPKPALTEGKGPAASGTPRSTTAEPSRGRAAAQTKTALRRTATAEKPVVHMDRKAFVRLKRGKLKPEARLDLHGMTLDRAHPALTRFILSAQASGKRLVLVITGKGRGGDAGGPIPTPQGVLRHQVPHWLAAPPLSQAVLQVVPAHVSHGGGGALYVYLRRATR